MCSWRSHSWFAHSVDPKWLNLEELIFWYFFPKMIVYSYKRLQPTYTPSVYLKHLEHYRRGAALYLHSLDCPFWFTWCFSFAYVFYSKLLQAPSLAASPQVCVYNPSAGGAQSILQSQCQWTGKIQNVHSFWRWWCRRRQFVSQSVCLHFTFPSKQMAG